MFDMLRFSDELPPAIYMHSFGGTVRGVTSLLRAGADGDSGGDAEQFRQDEEIWQPLLLRLQQLRQPPEPQDISG